MLEFNKRVLKIKFDDKVYEIAYPRVGEIRDYTSKLKSGKHEEVELVIEMLEKLGLPSSVTEKMEIDNLEAIIGELIKSKK